jgi:hypothetical protein
LYQISCKAEPFYGVAESAVRAQIANFWWRAVSGALTIVVAAGALSRSAADFTILDEAENYSSSDQPSRYYSRRAGCFE